MKRLIYYYAFGSPMAGRTHAQDLYRFGFNGKENDGETDTQDYGMRIYNPALGKFLSVDPLFKDFAWNSVYAFAENDVINCIDLDGGEKTYLEPTSGKLHLGPIDENHAKKMGWVDISNPTLKSSNSSKINTPAQPSVYAPIGTKAPVKSPKAPNQVSIGVPKPTYHEPESKTTTSQVEYVSYQRSRPPNGGFHVEFGISKSLQFKLSINATFESKGKKEYVPFGMGLGISGLVGVDYKYSTTTDEKTGKSITENTGGFGIFGVLEQNVSWNGRPWEFDKLRINSHEWGLSAGPAVGIGPSSYSLKFNYKTKTEIKNRQYDKP